MPTQVEIDQVVEVVRESLRLLIARDRAIFIPDNSEDIVVYDGQPEMERGLHEISINHRFAVYIEEQVNRVMPHTYSVDIEYNRYYNSRKVVDTPDGIMEVRPDILVHSRMDDTIEPQHYLAIETKKGQISGHDRNKIQYLMNDDKYLYMFGLTVSYCGCPHHIHSDLIYKDDQSNVITIPIVVDKE